MRPDLRLIAALALTCLAPVALADGDAAAGSVKFETCRGCHAVDSYTNAFPVYHVPKLGGQHATRIVAALQAYRSGERSHPTMIAQAASLSDQDMQDIAAYLVAEAGPAGEAHAGTAPERAQNVCSACHGADGNSPSPEFPILAGQHRDYIARALMDYRDGRRTNPIMAAQVVGISDAEIAELATWFATRSGPLQTPTHR